MSEPSDPRYQRHYAESGKEDQREAGERDRDRILYTAAFERLAGVTQVVGPLEGYVFHNRLTHTLQVAQIARRLAEKLLRENEEIVRELGGLNPDVVEAASLAHDLGHPPFGHVGEEELDRWARRYGNPEGFEGNAQSFRILVRLTPHRDLYKGLNLTRATLNAVLKYPWPRDTADPRTGNPFFKKFGFYRSDEADFDHARAGSRHREKSLEAAIMDYADAVAYSVHDLDDFYRAGLIPLDRLIPSQKGVVPRELESFLSRWLLRGRVAADQLTAEKEDLLRFLGNLPVRERFTGTFDQRALLRTCTSNLIKEFVFAARLGDGEPSTEPLLVDASLQFKIEFLKGLVWDYVITNPRLGTQQHGQRRVIRTLLRSYLSAVRRRDHSLVPPLFHRELEDVHAGTGKQPHPSEVRLGVDIVAGFTDSQALAMYRRLIGVSPGSVTELLHA